MKFKIVNSQAVHNEIFEVGARIVIGSEVGFTPTGIKYTGRIHSGILATSYSEKFTYREICFKRFDWAEDGARPLRDIVVPDIIGYEQDENNTLILVEKLV